MPGHPWHYCLLFLGERKKLRRKLTHQVAVKGHIIRNPEAIQDREQQQWVFKRLAKRFRAFDQNMRPFYSRFGFGRGISFDMNERVYQCNLHFDFFPS